MGLMDEHRVQRAEFERLMADEDHAREVRFHNSRIGRWWDAFLQRRYAKAMNRLKAMGREENL